MAPVAKNLYWIIDWHNRRSWKVMRGAELKQSKIISGPMQAFFEVLLLVVVDVSWRPQLSEDYLCPNWQRQSSSRGLTHQFLGSSQGTLVVLRPVFKGDSSCNADTCSHTPNEEVDVCFQINGLISILVTRFSDRTRSTSQPGVIGL